MKQFHRFLSPLLAFCLLAAIAPAASAADEDEDTHVIVLDSVQQDDGTYSHSASLDGAAVNEYDYTWHADPSQVHDEVDDAPAEYYTGTQPGDEAVYIAHDIYYYPELDPDQFVKVNYDGDQEWAYYYTAEGYEDYIFATLPVSGSSVPTDMMHTAEEAYENAVLHITQPGTYVLEGEWYGQIWIDLGDSNDTFTDPDAKVTLILNGVDVTCTVAPALVFYSVYECDNTWEDQTAWSHTVDTADAGANVILADGTVNNFSGENIYRMLEAKYKSGESSSSQSVALQKKRMKIDGAFYSYQSMNIDGQEEGTGVLNITAGYEGLDTELHLTINGGQVNIYSQNDGINVNEDGVSVVTINGGSLHILAGLGNEGDGIDSNGYLVINGGTVVAMANPNSDSGLDSDRGSYVNGGTVLALGSTMDWAEADDSNDSNQVTMNLQFSSSQSADEAIIVTDTDGNVVFAYDPDKDEVAGSNARWYQGAVLSCADLTVGEQYFVYVGGDVTGAETAGVYDITTVTGFTDEAKQQCYTGTDVGFGRPGGRPDDGTMPGEPPTEGDFPGAPPADGMTPGQPPEDGQDRPELPEDFDPSQMERPGGFDPGAMGGSGEQTNQTASIYFTMTDKVNDFSGVSDYDSQSTTLFTDVEAGSWYDSAVHYVYEKGLMTGTSTTTFSPSTTSTRGMMATTLYRMEGSPAVDGTISFSDVAEGRYDTEAILWASQEGLLLGYGNGTFGPDDLITREQLATLLYRYAAYKGWDTTSAADLSGYSDSGSISSFAQEAMAWAVAQGLIQGTGTSTLSPASSATRAEVATILMRFCQSFEA
ncbi:S-layer homology domain-containing protein [Flavonifractor sp. AGMB03687]|uniref:S-layer homology domain-containing protein n=1 Tax=Flavonifractor sp. AGMB03687 TaxID=2785133 RepID=UPI001ADEFE59|nr:S-layer homology domain-containing protein [Flavonifractor sp. AGMB03687]